MNIVKIAWMAPARPLFRGVRRRRGVCFCLRSRLNYKDSCYLCSLREQGTYPVAIATSL